MAKKLKKTKKLKKPQHYGAKFRAPEFVFYKKGVGWYIGLIIISLGLIFLFIWLKMWLAGAIIFLAMIVFIQYAKVRPKKYDVHIKADQIEIKNKVYPISLFKSFWIVFDRPSSTLYLETTKRFFPWIMVHIADKEALRIRHSLVNFLPEKKTISEDMFIKLNRWLRF